MKIPLFSLPLITARISKAVIIANFSTARGDCMFFFLFIFFNFYRLGHKRSLYEGGVRSPTMARWPKKIVQPFQLSVGVLRRQATFADLIGAPARRRTDGIHPSHAFRKDATPKTVHF